MTAKTSGSRKLKRSNLPKFDNDIYARISSSNLIVYSIHYLLEQKIEVRLEDIVFACFLLFPQKFSLKKYPRWPDSAVISRRLSVCRSKGYISTNTDLGIKLTAKGSRLAEKVAKSLGVSTTKRAAKAPHLKSKKPSATQARKVRPVKNKEGTNSLVIVTQDKSSQPKVLTVKPTKKSKIRQEIKITLPAKMKNAQTPPSNVHEVIAQPIQKEKTTLPAPVKKGQKTQSGVGSTIQLNKAQPLPSKKTVPFKPAKKAQPVQPISLVPPKVHRDDTTSGSRETRPATPKKNIKPLKTKRTKPPNPAVKPRVLEKSQPIQPQKVKLPAQQGGVSKEEKLRAGKFVRAMETSDAYKHYKKGGKNSKIGEFDFRSLLLCTMESSPETLARNVTLFKGYARIHNRQDLIVFLTFCEDKFTYLLKPKNKPARKAKNS